MTRSPKMACCPNRVPEFDFGGEEMKSLRKIGLIPVAIFLAVFALFALLDFAGIIVDNPLIPGK
jgi:hypothetical protein